MNHRETVILNYAAWTATSALRSGEHIKDGKSLQAALKEVVILHEIPVNQLEFDDWHEHVVHLLQKKVLELRGTTDNGYFSIGWSAKLLNVYLKTLYYVGDIGQSAIRAIIHPPIDNILVDAIIEEYGVSIWYGKEEFTIQGLVHYKEYAEMIGRLKQIASTAGLENLIDIEHVWSSTLKKSTNSTKYKLHEAMVEVLEGMPNCQGSFQEISDEINKTGKYKRRDGQDVPAFQIKLRAFMSGGRYKELFEKYGEEGVKLVLF